MVLCTDGTIWSGHLSVGTDASLNCRSLRWMDNDWSRGHLHELRSYRSKWWNVDADGDGYGWIQRRNAVRSTGWVITNQHR